LKKAVEGGLGAEEYPAVFSRRGAGCPVEISSEKYSITFS